MNLLQPGNSIPEWRKYFRDGSQYAVTAEKGMKNMKKFTPEILFNIIAMAIEKYIMAVMLKKGNLPEGHTLTDLIHALGKITMINSSIKEDIKFMESFQEICSIDECKYVKPDKDAICRMLNVCSQIEKLAASLLPDMNSAVYIRDIQFIPDQPAS